MKNILTYLMIGLAVCLQSNRLFAEMQIDKVNLLPTENQISLICSFHHSDTITVAENTINYSIWSVKNAGDTANLIVLSADLIAENKLELRAQAALSDAIYRSEQRNFIVAYNQDEQSYKATRKVNLVGFFQMIDLRPYTFTLTSKVGKKAVYSCLLILLFLIISIPVHYKFFFKKNNLRKFKDIKDDLKLESNSDEKSATEPHDPYTYEPFQDEHEVVLIEDKILLLETWKTLSENEEVKNDPAYAYLFSKEESGHFFKPATKLYQYLNNAWFGFLSGTLAYLLFQVSSTINLSGIEKYLSNIFNTHQQLSGLLTDAILLGTCFGFCFFTLTSTAVLSWKIVQHPVLHILKNSLIGTILTVLIFFEATLIGSYFQPWFNVCIAWLFMGLNFGLLIAFLNKKHWKKGIQKGLLAGGVSILLYVIMYYLIALAHFNATSCFVFNISLFASFLAVGTYQTETSTVPETITEASTLSELPKPSLQKKS